MNQKDPSERKLSVGFSCEPDLWERVKQYAKDNGYASASHFITRCLIEKLDGKK